jgi:Outer membrane protein beta-barrel domain
MVKFVVVLLMVSLLAVGNATCNEPVENLNETTRHNLMGMIVIGAMLGFTSHTLLGVSNETTTINSNSNLALGAFVRFLLSKGFSFQAIVRWITKGGTKGHQYEPLETSGMPKIAATEADGDPTEKVSLGYVQIPILIQYELPVKSKIKPRIMAGPAIAFNVSKKDEASGYGAWDGEHDIGNLKSTDLSGIIGVGATFPIGKLNLGLDFMYDRSFSSAFSDVTEEELANDVNEELWTKTDPETFERTTEAVDFKNSGFSVQLSVVFPL